MSAHIFICHIVCSLVKKISRERIVIFTIHSFILHYYPKLIIPYNYKKINMFLIFILIFPSKNMFFFSILHNFNTQNVTFGQIEQFTKTNKNAPRIPFGIAKLSLSEAQLGILLSVFYKITLCCELTCAKKSHKAQSKQSGVVFVLVRGVRIIGATVSRHFL